MNAPLPESSSPHRDVLTRKELSAYGSGIIAYQFPHVALAQLAIPLFNVSFGLAPALVGGILMAGRVWDATLNPIVGAVSDNTRTRWGRRRPFIFIGGMLSAIAYPAVWYAPQSWSPEMIGAYFLCSTLLLYTGFSVFSVPYVALGLELTPDYSERTRVQVWRSYFSLVPAFLGGWFYWFCQLPVFDSAAQGARWLGLMVGAVILVTALVPAIFLQEPYYNVASKVQKQPLWHSIREVVSTKPFAIFMVVIASLELGRFTTDHLDFYILAYYVFDGDKTAAAFLLGINTTVLVVVAILVSPIVQRIAATRGKITALRLCLIVNLTADFLKWFLVSPDHPWTWVIIIVLIHSGGIGFWILVNSIKADICDWDELATGRRREGAFAAVAGLIQKGAAAITLILAGSILQLIGFDASKTGAQTEETIFVLRVAYSAPSIILLCVSLWALSRYKLDTQVMLGVRRQLEERRDALGSPAIVPAR